MNRAFFTLGNPRGRSRGESSGPSTGQATRQVNDQVSAQINDQLDAVDAPASDQPAEPGARFAVGWRKLTRQEFLDAVSTAVLERVPRRAKKQPEQPDSIPKAKRATNSPE